MKDIVHRVGHEPIAHLPAAVTLLLLFAVVGCTDSINDPSEVRDAYSDEYVLSSDSDLDVDALLHDKNAPRGKIEAGLRSLMARQAPVRGLSFYKLPRSNHLNSIPADPKNPLTNAKVVLGQLLYHETALGTTTKQHDAYEGHSCASCHHAQGGFQANLPQGIAEGGVGFGTYGEGRSMDPFYDSSTDEKTPDIQPVRSPTAMNGAYQELMLWNGQFGGVGENIGTEAGWTGPKASNYLGMEGLETQAHAGLVVHRMGDIENSRVADIEEYRRLFARAFPTEAEPINRLNAALAIAAYERTLLSNQAPFQKWLSGDHSAMNRQHLRGALLFFGKAECSSCHTGPALNSMTFYAIGMNDLDGSIDPSRVDLRPWGGSLSIDDRRGRGAFSNRPEDEFAWKTPQLYNLMNSPFFGHGASFSSLRDVVEYKNNGIPQNPLVDPSKLSPLFKPLNLTPEEVDDIAAFLAEALYDPALMRYVPKSLPSDNCFPVNDAQAAADLGCYSSSIAAH